VNTIGLDLSLTSTGVSIDGETQVLSTKVRGPQRLSIISNQILNLIIENHIQIAIIEDYAFNARTGQAFSIGELGGCVRMRLWEAEIPYVEIPPTSRAKFATGKGNASKIDVISAISIKTGIEWSGPGADDRCDAWILEQMAKTKMNCSTFQWSATQLSALSSVNWEQLDSLLLSEDMGREGH
jgi:crossover junction endodeoxyribonuclease RuvC